MDRRSPVSVTASAQMCQPTPGRFPSGRLSGTDRILNVGFWIPLDAMEGIRGLIADLGVGHWDLPPSNHLQNLVKLIAGDAIRLPTSCGSQPVHAIEPYGLDDAGPDHPCRRVIALRSRGCQSIPASLDLRPLRPLVAKTGLVDFTRWLRRTLGQHRPWGDEDFPALVTARVGPRAPAVSTCAGRTVAIRRLTPAATLMEQGAAGQEIRIVFEGILAVEFDGQVISEIRTGSTRGGNSQHWSTTSSSLASCQQVCKTGQGCWHPGSRLGGRSRTDTAKLEQRRFDPAVAVTLAKIPTERFRRVEP